MKKEFQKMLLEKVGTALNTNNFYLVDSSSKWILYHRKTDYCIEIIQIAQDKYESFLNVSASIVFLNVPNKATNVNYAFFNEFYGGNFKKIGIDACRDKFFLKGNLGEEFHYGDIYLALGRGIVGINPDSKKPIGIRIKKFNSETYEQLCNLIIKRLEKAFCWLDNKKQSVQ